MVGVRRLQELELDKFPPAARKPLPTLSAAYPSTKTPTYPPTHGLPTAQPGIRPNPHVSGLLLRRLRLRLLLLS